MQTLSNAIPEINKNLNHAPEAIIPDSKIYRFGPDKECWYAAHEWEYKGNTYHSVTYASWKEGKEYQWKSYDQKQARDKNFQRAYTQKTQDAQIKLKREKEIAAQNCIKKWRPIFDAAKNSAFHEYLDYKKIESFNTRVDSRNTLLVPMYDHEKFVGVQLIWWGENKYEKRFSKGVKMQGAICPLSSHESLVNAPYIYLSEGLATAASIQMAFPKIPSVCGFNASNLIHAINTIRHKNPSCKIIIAADNDVNRVGEYAAKKCANHYSDVIFKVVQFPQNSPKEWSDFNDLHNFESLKAVKGQLEIDPNDFAFVEAIGHDEEANRYYYISSENTQVVPLSSAQHNDSGLYRIIASDNYWLKNYGVEKDGERKTNWKMAMRDLMNKCHEAGEFDPTKLRGIGVWKDGDQYVFNNGHEVFNKPANSRFFYRKGSKINIEKKHYDKLEVQELLKNLGLAINSFRYKNQNDAIILCAWVIQSQIFTVMPWRFWVWIIGNRGTGKSTILKMIGKLAPNYVISSDATESGIAQTIKSNATAVILDEIETTTDGKENKKLQPIKDMMRRLNTNDVDDRKMRGTSGGISIVHNTQACFLLGSIRSAIKDSADISRIFMVEMDSIEDQTHEVWLKINSAFEAITSKKSELFSYCFDSIETILKNKEIISVYLKSKHKLESRLCDQISSMLACFNVFISDEIISNKDIKAFIKETGILDSNYTEENTSENNDDDIAYNDLMSQIIDYRDQTTIEKALRKMQENHNHEIYKDLLWTHGIIYRERNDSIFVCNKKMLKNLEGKKLDLAFFDILKRSKKYCLNDRAVCTNNFTLKTIRGIDLKIV